MTSARGRWGFVALLGLMVVAGIGARAEAQVPEKINYQGMLTTAGGQPVTASLPMVFRLYAAAVGGSALYSETQTVAVNNGVFTVAVGSVTPLSLAFDVPYYLGVTVGADPEMTPRQAVLASPYALTAAYAEDSQTLGGHAAADYILVGGAIAGTQITGAITGATLPAGNLTGTIGGTQIANNAVTQAKLSPVSGATAGKVLGTDGSNLVWQSAGSSGTLTSVATGTGLTGGPITTTGTIGIADGGVGSAQIASGAIGTPQLAANAVTQAKLSPVVGAAAGKVLGTDGSNLVWQTVATGGGTVTSVGTGSGLTGGPITTAGTIAIANSGVTAAMLASNGCASGQLMKWSGSAWACAADDNAAAGGAAGQVLAGTAGAPAWTGSPSLSGNLTLVPSTATDGNVWKGANLFIHNFGTYNTFIGERAGNLLMSGNNNTGSGFYALYNNSTGSANTAGGRSALLSNTTGTNNTAFGAGALQFNVSGANNTASGVFALAQTTNGVNNTANGAYALQWNEGGSSNTAVGYAALGHNTTGAYNVANGESALYSNTTGQYNTASGVNALKSNTTGEANTASGVNALMSNVGGNDNTAFGGNALKFNTTGKANTASGASALINNIDGYENTASGMSALYNNTTGNRNTASGMSALLNNTTGHSNIAIGADALSACATCSFNIAIGYQAGVRLHTGSENILIGSVGEEGDSRTIRIGFDEYRVNPPVLMRTFIAGIREGYINHDGTMPVMVDLEGQLGTAPSSRRFKDDIADMSEASAALMKLRPVTFHYKTDRSPAGRMLQYGLIAEEVAEVYPGLVAHSANGSIESVMYQFLPPMLLNEYQKQQRTIEAQAVEVTRLTAEVRTQTAQIAMLKRDREAQMARIDALEKQASELATLKQQVAQMAQMQQQAATLAARVGPFAAK